METYEGKLREQADWLEEKVDGCLGDSLPTGDGQPGAVVAARDGKPIQLKHLPFVFAALWSIGASSYLFFTPLYTVHKVTHTDVAGHSEAIEQVSRATLYEVNGPRVVAILIFQQ